MSPVQSLPWFDRLEPFCLASSSPRRLELLRQVGLDPPVVHVHVDETMISGESPAHYVERMARLKAESGLAHGYGLSLGADTVVTLEGEVFGKPKDSQAARTTLTRLAGQVHQVITAVALARRQPQRTRMTQATTSVWMKPANPEEIDAYVAGGEPMDKAGAYGIQGQGAFLVARIEGSYSAVVGLPIFETLILLSQEP